MKDIKMKDFEVKVKELALIEEGLTQKGFSPSIFYAIKARKIERDIRLQGYKHLVEPLLKVIPHKQWYYIKQTGMVVYEAHINGAKCAIELEDKPTQGNLINKVKGLVEMKLKIEALALIIEGLTQKGFSPDIFYVVTVREDGVTMQGYKHLIEPLLKVIPHEEPYRLEQNNTIVYELYEVLINEVKCSLILT